ncbi:MAG TPA: hypothetical protein VFM01_01465, partial [Nakamurella sp.]|nr:hypothetical protein [Nakamurella sp.]
MANLTEIKDWQRRIRSEEKPVTRRYRIEDLASLAVPEQPALSSDGSRILYVLRTVDAGADKYLRAIWTVGTRDGAPRQLTRGTADSSPVWSPDGQSVAFLRAQDGPAQLWLLPAGGGEPEQLTHLPLGAGTPLWSPDGSRIAFAAPVDLAAPAPDGDQDQEDAAARQKRAGAPIVVDRLDYQADGAGLLRKARKHLHVLDLDTRRCRQLTDGDWHASDPAWSPDGTRLAFGAAMADDADLVMRAPAYLLDVTDTWSAPREVALGDGVVGAVDWTADGSALLIAGTTDGPLGHTRLLRVPLDGG